MLCLIICSLVSLLINTNIAHIILIYFDADEIAILVLKAWTELVMLQ